MKTIVSASQDIGADGAKASESLVLEGGMLKAKVEIAYPIAQALKPVTDLLDSAFTAVEDAIPGDWDKALLDPVKEKAKADLIALLSE